MNVYIVVEGEIGEKKVYEKWIPFVNGSLTYSPTINNVTANNFYIAIGGGYPNLFEIIEDGIEDVSNLYAGGHRLFDRFVVVIDSEDCTLKDKNKEITDFVDEIVIKKKTYLDYRVIVQHFCLETWALGNRRIFSNNIGLPDLARYKSIFNVAKEDPELLPALPGEELNRSQFANKYLTRLLNNKHRNHSYSKSNPGALLHEKYFEQIKLRHNETKHISSFDSFLTAFI